MEQTERVGVLLVESRMIKNKFNVLRYFVYKQKRTETNGVNAWVPQPQLSVANPRANASPTNKKPNEKISKIIPPPFACL